jgi:hypothetical protein
MLGVQREEAEGKEGWKGIRWLKVRADEVY